jgi:hypothetical protein
LLPLFCFKPGVSVFASPKQLKSRPLKSINYQMQFL